MVNCSREKYQSSNIVTSIRVKDTRTSQIFGIAKGQLSTISDWVSNKERVKSLLYERIGIKAKIMTFDQKCKYLKKVLSHGNLKCCYLLGLARATDGQLENWTLSGIIPIFQKK